MNNIYKLLTKYQNLGFVYIYLELDKKHYMQIHLNNYLDDIGFVLKHKCSNNINCKFKNIKKFKLKSNQIKKNNHLYSIILNYLQKSLLKKV